MCHPVCLLLVTPGPPHSLPSGCVPREGDRVGRVYLFDDGLSYPGKRKALFFGDKHAPPHLTAPRLLPCPEQWSAWRVLSVSLLSPSVIEALPDSLDLLADEHPSVSELLQSPRGGPPPPAGARAPRRREARNPPPLW